MAVRRPHRCPRCRPTKRRRAVPARRPQQSTGLHRLCIRRSDRVAMIGHARRFLRKGHRPRPKGEKEGAHGAPQAWRRASGGYGSALAPPWPGRRAAPVARASAEPPPRQDKRARSARAAPRKTRDLWRRLPPPVCAQLTRAPQHRPGRHQAQASAPRRAHLALAYGSSDGGCFALAPSSRNPAGAARRHKRICAGANGRASAAAQSRAATQLCAPVRVDPLQVRTARSDFGKAPLPRAAGLHLCSPRARSRALPPST
ncbi:hypothetical protein SAMN06295984_1845 [Sphingopyxis terrae subsp. ummariensis]|uniref:Uncharacterized protein n=1 Tax=Sphingopyxis terrae subsp. ummariensis TaxID=429001 RepID=A0A1Y6FNC5_9SPHN|nr:hypothetical protein SAMN06295984_1845 [Sphingopyxis terrae subsp. ummariensis]